MLSNHRNHPPLHSKYQRSTFVIQPLIAAAVLAIFLLLYTGSSSAIAETPGTLYTQQQYPDIENETNLNTTAPDSAKTPILILGTTHLSNISEEFSPGMLDSLIYVLTKYKPKVIAVESPRDKFYSRTKSGETAREYSGLSWQEAHEKSDSLLKKVQKNHPNVSPDTRIKLVESLFAADRKPTAALQWSYLSEEYRNNQTVVADTLATLLDLHAHSSNEIYSIGIRLARKLGRQQVYPVDSHSEGDMVSEIVPQLRQVMDKSFTDSVMNSPVFKKEQSLLQEGIKSGNLMPLYRYMNSPEYQTASVEAQWRIFLRTPFPGKAGRARLAFWEMRNLTMAANIQRASGQHPTEPVLFIVGAAHKIFLDAYLKQMMGVNVIHLNDILEKQADESK